MQEFNTRSLMSEAKFYEAYSRWDDEKGRYETWDEAVDRVMKMHKMKYDDKLKDNTKLQEFFQKAEDGYKAKRYLGAQRALQFGGDQILKNNMRMYNCTSCYLDSPERFGEIFWVSLCGSGVGFSVQKHHIDKLPEIAARNKQPKTFVAPDSIEGWAQCLDVLLSSYFVGGGKHPEYEGRKVYFDLSKIRPKGSKISGGFKAPGPDPLRKALDHVEFLLQGLILKGQKKLKSINAYDIIMHCSDAVLSGGVRRAATICIFSIDDEEMMKAKTGNWFVDNPQRGRSNNSALVLRNGTTKEQFSNLFQHTKEYGEPGFIFADTYEALFNPCVEIGMYGHYEDDTGFQGCNLVEINGFVCDTPEKFYQICEEASIMGTIQAGYTDFKFVSETTRKIFEREALLGVSITGWMNSPNILFDKEVLENGAKIVKETNKKVAKLLGINTAARTTCTKPAGTTSVLLGTASGIHPEHSPKYIRNMQMNKDQEVGQLIKKQNPYMIEDSVWNSRDFVISFPVTSSNDSHFKKDMLDTKFLEKVKFAQEHWVESGTNKDLCVEPGIRHNISNTVVVPEHRWDKVKDYLFENKEFFAGVSFISESGDKDYPQAPFTQVFTEKQIIEMYGEASLFASGLIVDGLSVFNTLWEACSSAQNDSDENSQEKLDSQADWIRRFYKFADTYFDGNLKTTEYCLKDVYLLHKWCKIRDNYKSVSFTNDIKEIKYTDIDTISAEACHGGACEL